MQVGSERGFDAIRGLYEKKRSRVLTPWPIRVLCKYRVTDERETEEREMGYKLPSGVEADLAELVRAALEEIETVERMAWLAVNGFVFTNPPAELVAA